MEKQRLPTKQQEQDLDAFRAHLGQVFAKEHISKNVDESWFKVRLNRQDNQAIVLVRFASPAKALEAIQILAKAQDGKDSKTLVEALGAFLNYQTPAQTFTGTIPMLQVFRAYGQSVVHLAKALENGETARISVVFEITYSLPEVPGEADVATESLVLGLSRDFCQEECLAELKEQDSKKCWCCKASAPAKRCGRCNIAVYCNARCAENYWKIKHKLHCPLLKTSFSNLKSAFSAFATVSSS